MSTFLYPLDVTGSALSNRVRGEYQTLQPPTQSDNFHFILPRSGPYYRDTLKIIHVPTGRPLIRGIDWEPGHYFHSASYETESVKGGIYQSILFLDRTLAGQVHLEEYFVLGGTWSLDEATITEVLSNKLHDPRITTYEQVSNKPDVFPPIDHMHPAGDLTGMRELVAAQHDTAAALREQTQELPGKLRIILADYYTAREIDTIIQGLSEEVLEGIVGPEMEILVNNLVAQMLGNYYTKSAIDQTLNAISLELAKRYTKLETDNLLEGKVDKTQYQLDIAGLVTKLVFDSTIDGITSQMVYKEEFNRGRTELDSADAALGVRIDGLGDSIQGIANNLVNYVLESELVDKITGTAPFTELATQIGITRNELLEHILIINSNIDDIYTTLLDYTTLSEVQDLIAGAMQASSGLDPSLFDAMKVSHFDMVESMFVNALKFTVVSQTMTPDGLPTSLVINVAEGNETTALYENKMTPFDIPQGQYTVTIPPGLPTVENYSLIMTPTILQSGIEITVKFKLDAGIIPSRPSEANVARVYKNGSALTLTPLFNDPAHLEELDQTITFTAAQSKLPTPIIVSVPTHLAHRSEFIVNEVYLTDPAGNSVPIHRANIEYDMGLSGTVSLFRPGLDLSLFPGTPVLTLRLVTTLRSL